MTYQASGFHDQTYATNRGTAMDMINRWREDLLAQQDQQCPGRLDARERDLWDEERLDRLRHLVEEGHWGDEHTR